jgi:hypothetical protein
MPAKVSPEIAAFASRIWKPASAMPDPAVPSPTIGEQGQLRFKVHPITGPENEAERFATTVWFSVSPSRWFMSADFGTSVFITETGLLVGEILKHDI